MSGDAVKAYVYLLSQSWLEIPRATIPKNDNELAIIANITLEKWMTIKEEVLQHFEVGKCEEHLGRFYQETLLEISRNSESKQRFKNKNAKRTQNKRTRSDLTDTEYEYDNANKNESENASKIESEKEINPNYKNVCEILKSRILEHRQQKITDTVLKKWAQAVDLMVRRDNRAIADIEALINECHDMAPSATGFTWRNNILSMEKLRLRWNEGKIFIGMNKANKPKQSFGRQEVDSDRIKENALKTLELLEEKKNG
jgi:uncharacterized protein YdaU (DUF1376 family)